MDRVLLCLLALVVIVPLSRADPVPLSDQEAARLQADVQKRIDESRAKAGFPGISVGVAFPDGRVIAVASGLADVENKVPLKPTDRLLAGSVGKTYVAAVLLQLVEEEKVGLDDKVSRWLGKEPWFARLPNAPDLTVRSLLTHSAGIPEYFLQKQFGTVLTDDPDRVWKPAELIEFVLDAKPLFPVGQGFSYADTDYILAGMVFEKAAGKPLFDEIDRRLLQPLNLKQTIASDRRVIPGLVPGYTGRGNPLGYEGRTLRDGKFVINPQFEWAGGGLASTPSDLALWARALYEGKAFKKEQTLKEMLKGVDTGGGRGGGKGVQYGLGVQLRPSPLGRTYGHSGWFPGYRTEVEYFPEYRVAIAVQFNTDVGRSLGRGTRAHLMEVAGVVLPPLKK